jgi:hypothetical protein
MTDAMKKKDTVQSAVEVIPFFSAAYTARISLYNDGVDAKSDIRLSLSDAAGHYKVLTIVKSLGKGKNVTIDLLSQEIGVTRAALMYRGADGVGRYLYSNVAGSGMYFKTLYCSWAVLPIDQTIEEWAFIGS